MIYRRSRPPGLKKLQSSNSKKAKASVTISADLLAAADELQKRSSIRRTLTTNEARRDLPGRKGPQPGSQEASVLVVVSRQTLLDSKAAHAVCAPINTEGRELETEVQVGPEHGFKHTSYINCDQLVRIEKSKLTDYVGKLPGAKVKALNTALRVALDLD